MKYYIIAGEASGDLHGSNLIKALHRQDGAADIRCWGGDKMQAAGATLVKHYKDLAFMGFVEVLKNLRTIFRNLAFCKEDIQAFRPDVLILIDYPGFNLRIAKWTKAQGLKVIYYISPQVWAWKENRVKMMKECIDRMICILPFEKDYYRQKWNWDVDYVGHPLVEAIEQFLVDSRQSAVGSQEIQVGSRQSGGNNKNNNSVIDTHGSELPTDDSRLQAPDLELPTDNSKTIALLPGSRKQEILQKLPIMLEVSRHFPAYRFVVAKAPGVEADFYDVLLAPYNNVSYVANQTYSLLSEATAALVTSGTATLETALFGVPEVICYKGNAISYQIARRLVKIKFIGLVNLIMDKEVVKELIQHELTVDNLKNELNKLLNDPAKISQVKEDYRQLKEILSQGGHASENAAKLVMREMGGGSWELRVES